MDLAQGIMPRARDQGIEGKVMDFLDGRRFAFYAKRYSRKKASIRLRLLEPLAALRAAGVDVERYSQRTGAAAYDGVVISKAFGRRSVKVAEDARRSGSGLIFDICDNRFANKRVKGSTQHAGNTSRQLARADIVTVPTETMGELLVATTPEIAGRVRVVPDMLEDVESLSSVRPSLLDRWRLSRLQSFLNRHPGALHCVWFGNNMAGVSGVGEMEHAIAELRRFAEHHPVTLTIINNQPAAYRKSCIRWGIPSVFMPWTLNSFLGALRKHRVAIIPVAQNAYTAGKSINRPATAIMAGLGVIADSIASYEELRPFIALDDWQGGLDRYAFRWDEEEERLAAARQHLDRAYGRARVVERWTEIFRELAERAR